MELRLRRIDGEYRWFLCRVKAIRNDSGRLLRWIGVSWDIHDRKTAESLLRIEEETYRRIVDSVPACVCVGGPTGELVYVNKVGVAALGRPMEEIVSDRWMAYIHPDDMQAARQQWKACIAAREPVDIAVRMQQHDGLYRWQRLLAEPSRSSNGEVINWYLVGIEIEETIRAQQALAASEREARELLDRLPGRFATRTADGFDFINQQILEETGTTTGADGKLRWYLARSEPFRDESGQILHWYGVCTDINDLKQTEAVLEQREHQLHELIETIPAMLWCNDPQGGLTYINRKTSEFVGLDISQLANLGYRKTFHPDDLDSVLQAWTHSIETGEPYCHVARLRRIDGVYRWYQNTAEAMRDSDGNIVQWDGLSLDIDERKRAEDRLRQTQAELARATQIATVAELSASIAHELNQPLTSVIANAQACKRWLAASPPNLGDARVSVESVVRDAR
ncbi:PAS domain-containing protein [Paraburkholderia sediminicola]|uniref:PAS domain-containing protein n=1 Tax=Paraburkholderia sediminicola TaxID=458836 RepID=UPI0038B91BE6